MAEELRGRAHLVAGFMRAGVMAAGDEPPQPSLAQQRDGHRRGDAHVAQIFEVDRRDAAQPGVAEVERRSRGRIQGGHDRHRLIVDVGDQPQPGTLVQRPRLDGNVAGRIVQAAKAVEPLEAGLGDHLAVPLRVEPVDHHPVEAGQPPDLLDHDVVELGERAGAVEPQHRLPGTGVGADIGQRTHALSRLQFAGDEFAHPMQQRVVVPPVVPVAEQEVHRARLAQVERGAHHIQDGLGHGRPGDLAQRTAEQLVGLAPECLRHVRRHPRDREIVVGAHGEQHAVRLHAARDVDRFPVAVRQVDGPVEPWFQRLLERPGDRPGRIGLARGPGRAGDTRDAPAHRENSTSRAPNSASAVSAQAATRASSAPDQARRAWRSWLQRRPTSSP